MNLSWNSKYFGYLMRRADSFEKTLMLEKIEGRRRGADRGWDGWMASPTQWTWVWVDSGSWWWTGRPGVLQFMGPQRVGHDWATELNWTELNWRDLKDIVLCVLSHFSHVQFFVTLWTVAHQVPLSVGFSRQEYRSGLLCPPSGDLPNPGIEPTSLTSPALTSRFFTTSLITQLVKKQPAMQETLVIYLGGQLSLEKG